MNTNPTCLDTSQTVFIPICEGQSIHEYEISEGVDCTFVLASLNRVSVETKFSVSLVGSGARATILGIIVAGNSASVRFHTMQIHTSPDTVSNLLIKTVVGGQAKVVVDGGIHVLPGAQKTNAYQRNENLLLSSTAHAESKPSLEILANDVRCTHGATVSPISEEELWYLRSRGIPLGVARQLIITGYLRSAVDRIADPQVRESVWQSIESAL